jgi:hypothetical protein
LLEGNGIALLGCLRMFNPLRQVWAFPLNDF